MGSRNNGYVVEIAFRKYRYLAFVDMREEIQNLPLKYGLMHWLVIREGGGRKKNGSA